MEDVQWNPGLAQMLCASKQEIVEMLSSTRYVSMLQQTVDGFPCNPLPALQHVTALVTLPHTGNTPQLRLIGLRPVSEACTLLQLYGTNESLSLEQLWPYPFDSYPQQQQDALLQEFVAVMQQQGKYLNRIQVVASVHALMTWQPICGVVAQMQQLHQQQAAAHCAPAFLQALQLQQQLCDLVSAASLHAPPGLQQQLRGCLDMQQGEQQQGECQQAPSPGAQAAAPLAALPAPPVLSAPVPTEAPAAPAVDTPTGAALPGSSRLQAPQEMATACPAQAAARASATSQAVIAQPACYPTTAQAAVAQLCALLRARPELLPQALRMVGGLEQQQGEARLAVGLSQPAGSHSTTPAAITTARGACEETAPPPAMSIAAPPRIQHRSRSSSREQRHYRRSTSRSRSRSPPSSEQQKIQRLLQACSIPPTSLLYTALSTLSHTRPAAATTLSKWHIDQLQRMRQELALLAVHELSIVRKNQKNYNRFMNKFITIMPAQFPIDPAHSLAADPQLWHKVAAGKVWGPAGVPHIVTCWAGQGKVKAWLQGRFLGDTGQAEFPHLDPLHLASLGQLPQEAAIALLKEWVDGGRGQRSVDPGSLFGSLLAQQRLKYGCC